MTAVYNANYYYFSGTLLVLLILIVWLGIYYNMLKDQSTATPRPYSFSRVQLAWWSWILLSCFISLIWITGKIPTLNNSVLVLLGIGGLTTGLARTIDTSDAQKTAAMQLAGIAAPALSVNSPGQNFFLDILSDNTGVSIHRLQSFLFNLAFGVYYLYNFITVIGSLHGGSDAGAALYDFNAQQLGLLGISNATYLGMKSAENR